MASDEELQVCLYSSVPSRNFHFEILKANLRHVNSLIQAATIYVRFFSFSFFKSCAKFCLNSQKRKRAFLKGRIPHYCMSIIVNELKKIEPSESCSGIEGPLLSSYVTRVLPVSVESTG